MYSSPSKWGLGIKFSWIIILLLLLSEVLFAPQQVNGKSNNIVFLSPEEARLRALDHIKLQVDLGKTSQWENVTLSAPIILYDLTGNISGYLFQPIAGNKQWGYLVVSPIDIPNPILEYTAEGLSPILPLDSESELKITAARYTLVKDKPLYLGILNYGYELILNGERKYYDLMTSAVIPIDDSLTQTPFYMQVSKAQSTQGEQELQPQTPTGSSIIANIPDWNQFWGSYGCYSGCSPTAATNVIGFWDYSYGNLMDLSNYQAATDELRIYMSTQCSGSQGFTFVSNISGGMITYASAHGYQMTSGLISSWGSTASYEKYVGEIDAGRPMVVSLINLAGYGDHSVTGVGYDTGGGNYMVVHDNWPNTAENVKIQYGVGYSDIFINWFDPKNTLASTTVTLLGTKGDNGWYISPVQATISSTGYNLVSQIQYKIDAGNWQTYIAPFSVTGDGRHTVYYISQELYGTWDIERSRAINIDSTAPAGSVSIQNGAAQTQSTLVKLTALATDAASGVSTVRFRDPGQSWSNWFTYPTSLTWLLSGQTGRALTVEGQFKDKAGHISSVFVDNIVLNLYPAMPSSRGYWLVRSTWGASGTEYHSSQYALNGTLGQPAIVSSMQNENYVLKSGYWAQSNFIIPPRSEVFLPIVFK